MSAIQKDDLSIFPFKIKFTTELDINQKKNLNKCIIEHLQYLHEDLEKYFPYTYFNY
jgi:hypothetical protein